MAIQSFMLDPNAAAYSDDQIVDKVNAASNQITRADAVAAAARPIGAGEVGVTELAATAARDNLDLMADTVRGYIQTNPVAGQFPVISIERASDGKAKIDYDDQPIT